VGLARVRRRRSLAAEAGGAINVRQGRLARILQELALAIG
jgi:hypothetical protein